MCDGIYDCPGTETTNEGEEEEDCSYGETNWIETMPAKSMLGLYEQPRLYL